MFAVWGMQPLPPMTFQASADGCASEPFSEPFREAAFLCHRAWVWSGLRALCLRASSLCMAVPQSVSASSSQVRGCLNLAERNIFIP